jgi:hypothetical protein
MLKLLVAVAAAASFAWTVNVEVPATAGVPVMVPAAAFRVRPLGSEPAMIDQVYGVTPPFAVSVAEYVVPAVPGDNEAVVTVSGADCTVKVVLPETEPSVAEILLVPAARAVASPPALIVAVPVVEDVQVTWPVMFCVLPPEYVPVAVNCCVAPAWIVGLAGVTAIDTGVGAGPELNTTSTQ